MASAINKVVSSVSRNIPVLVEKSKPKLNKFVYYAKSELVPPSPADIPQVIQGFNNVVRGARTGAWKKLTVREAWLNTLITVEVLCWFFVGECIGKRKIIGYDV